MTDRFTVRSVVCFLGVAMILGLSGLIWLVGTTEVRDAALLAVVAGPTGTVIGSLGTLLARTGSDVAQPVTVMNQGSAEAIPVDDKPEKK